MSKRTYYAVELHIEGEPHELARVGESIQVFDDRERATEFLHGIIRETTMCNGGRVVEVKISVCRKNRGAFVRAYEVYELDICDACGDTVKPKIVDGKQLVHPLSEEELEAEMLYGNYDDDDLDW